MADRPSSNSPTPARPSPPINLDDDLDGDGLDMDIDAMGSPVPTGTCSTPAFGKQNASVVAAINYITSNAAEFRDLRDYDLILKEEVSTINSLDRLPEEVGVWHRIDYSKLEPIGFIGRGSYGRVDKMEYQGTPVAVKELFLRTDRPLEQTRAEFEREVSVMCRLRHPNVVLFIGYCLEPRLCIVMDFMWITVSKLLYDNKQNGQPWAADLTFKKKLAFCHDCALGLNYLHLFSPAPIVHGDLKPANLLLDRNWRVQIADFGTTTILKKERDPDITSMGTLLYSAPEVFSTGVNDTRSDVWSFGVTVWEIFSGRKPYEDLKTETEVIRDVFLGGRRLALDHLPPQIRELCTQCLADDPAARPSATMLCTRLKALLASAIAAEAEAAAAAKKK